MKSGGRTAGGSEKGQRSRTWFVALLVSVTALVAHSECLGAVFYLDDQNSILNLPADLGGKWPWKTARFLTILIWNATHAAFGLSPAAFHALGLAAHVAVSLSVWSLAGILLRVASTKKEAVPAPGIVAPAAALLFAAHPLGTAATCYATQLSIQLVTLFCVLGSVFALRWLEKGRTADGLAILVLGTLCIMAKPTGLVHFPVTLGLLVLGVRGRALLGLAGRRRKPLIIVAGIAGIALVFVVPWSAWLAEWSRGVAVPGFGDHFLTQGRVFWHYLRLVLVPIRLCSDHLVPATVSSRDAVAWVGLGGIAFLVVALGVLHRRGWVIASVAGWIALAQLLIRFVWVNDDPLVEYRAYPALPWLMIVAAIFLAAATARNVRRFPAVLFVLVATMAGLSFKRCLVWHRPESIAENVLARYPLHLRVHSYLQWHDLNGGRPDRVLTRQPEVEAILNTILAYNRDAGGRRRYPAAPALASFMVSEQLAGYALVQLGRPGDAVARMTEAIDEMLPFFGNDRWRPFAPLYRARGKAKAALGDAAGAREDYEACLERKPGDAETLILLEELRTASGAAP